MKFGGHACLFSERIKTETDYILENFAHAGFQGVEIGYRFFGEDMESLSQSLSKNKLELSGFHCGITFSDLVNETEKTQNFFLDIGKKIASLPKNIMPHKNIIMSADYGCNPMRGSVEEGSLLNDRDFLEKCSKKLNAIVEQLADIEVTLNYHNHNQEFERNQKIFNILRAAAPSLHFAFDIGWIYFGGGDVLQILKENSERICYIHLRDGIKESKEFVPLGSGDFDYLILMKEIETIIKDGWAIVEYETGVQDFGRYTKAKQYLESIGY